MPVAVGTVVARTAGGVQAFVAGRRLGQELVEGTLWESEVKRVIERESVTSLAMAAVAIGTAAFAFLRKRELIVLALAGVLVGSGLLERAIGSVKLPAPRASRPDVAPE